MKQTKIDDTLYDVPEEAKYKAQDMDGEWYWYDKKPRKYGCTWGRIGSVYEKIVKLAHPKDWTKTLTEVGKETVKIQVGDYVQVKGGQGLTGGVATVLEEEEKGRVKLSFGLGASCKSYLIEDLVKYDFIPTPYVDGTTMDKAVYTEKKEIMKDGEDMSVSEDMKFDFGEGGNELLSTMVQEILFSCGKAWHSSHTTVWEPEKRFIDVEGSFISYYTMEANYIHASCKETNPYKFLAKHNKLAEYIEKEYGLLAECNNGEKVEFTDVDSSKGWPIKGVCKKGQTTRVYSWHVSGALVCNPSTEDLKKVSKGKYDFPKCVEVSVKTEDKIYDFDFKMKMDPQGNPKLQKKVVEKLKAFQKGDMSTALKTARYLFIYPKYKQIGCIADVDEEHFKRHKNKEVDPYEFIGEISTKELRKASLDILGITDDCIVIEGSPEFEDGPEFAGYEARTHVADVDNTLFTISKVVLGEVKRIPANSRRVQYTGATTKRFKKDHIYYINEFGSNPNPEHITNRYRDELRELTYALAVDFKPVEEFVEDRIPMGISMFESY